MPDVGIKKDSIKPPLSLSPLLTYLKQADLLSILVRFNLALLLMSSYINYILHDCRQGSHPALTGVFIDFIDRSPA